ncbi:MAG: HDOD domain-containing protein [Spartobacteria bacterium]|nr:HDOD domain-containing protein [Spartobacteria bacterium]
MIKQLKVKALIKKLKSKQINSVPAVLAQLLKVSRDPLSDAQDLANICEKDPAISARLVKMANSAYFGKTNRQAVDTIIDAIVRIGFRRSEEIIISATVCASLTNNAAHADFTPWDLWKHSYAVATCNRAIGYLVFDKPMLDPFLAGLLHDIGIMVEQQFCREDAFVTALEQRQANDSCLTAEENSTFGFTHEEIGDALGREWNLPEHITAVMGHHHDLNVENKKIRTLIHMTRISEWICSIMKMGYSDFGQTHAEELLQSRSFLHLSDADIEQIAKVVEKEMERLGNLGWFPLSNYRVA